MNQAIHIPLPDNLRTFINLWVTFAACCEVALEIDKGIANFRCPKPVAE